MGGRGGGRSTSASQYATANLVSPTYFRCAIMRYILGDIRNSIYQEIYDRMEEQDILDQVKITETTMKFEYSANSINAVGFRKSSGGQKAKLKSLASYNCVIIEEADEIPEEDFMQLTDSIRTVKGDIRIILLLNPPPKSHWIVSRWLKLIPTDVKGFFDYQLKDGVSDTVLIKSDYRDNLVNISPQSIAQYEKYKEDKPEHYWNMIRGYIPETVQGRIFSGWKIINEIPFEARLERYGLDFGYSNDPTAIVAIYRYNGGFIVDEKTYIKELSNKRIADILLNLPKALVVADSAEPKSIDEIASYGISIVASQKGQGSVLQGIQYVQDQNISITARSINGIKEYENYAWKIDKDSGEVLNIPNSGWDHFTDALRYGMESLKPYETINSLLDESQPLVSI